MELDSKRLQREQKTVNKMIAIYCHGHHATKKHLCDECSFLAEYAENRLQRCIYGPGKPACSECKTHCYKKKMREKIRKVMRYAGPRMILHSPFLAVMHLVDKFSKH